MEHEPAFVLFVTGPAGAGKSAAAEAWACAQSRPTAHIELDDVRDYVRSGWADPRAGWTAETDRQYRIARRNCADMARRYVSEGISCVIDDAIFPLWEVVNYAGWSELLLGIPHYLLVLLPSYEAILQRNALRDGRRLLEPTMLRVIYDMMLPWREQHAYPAIDTTAHTIDETAQLMQEALDQLRASTTP